ncbi:acyltransferase [Sphingobium aquiterrae]|uniref:acyltransferase family protein n=1 Tax=Sphingobium aquiterrae TaxID=2038656 RepID=UPI00301A973D
MKETADHARTHDLTSIQCLRGIAALMIVLYHCFPQLMRMGYAGSDFMPLSSGVDIFFVISGFIMLYSAARSPGRGPGAFLMNRAIRILPLYWLLTVLVAGLALFLPQVLQSSRFEIGHVVASFLMIAAAHPVSHEWRPLVIPGWSLNYEMFFYLVFAAGLWLARGRIDRLLPMVGGAILLVAAVPLAVAVRGPAVFYTDGIILEFVYGMVACRLFLHGWKMGPGLCWALILLGALAVACVTYVPFIPRPFSLGLPCLMIFAGVLHLPFRETRWGVGGLKLLGDASYSLYLSHWMTLSALGQVWRRLGLADVPGRDMLFVIAGVAASILVALIIYRWIEMPITEGLKRGLSARRPATGKAAPVAP